MDVLTSMYDHHIDTTRSILDRLDGLDDAVLDGTIELSVEGTDDDPTLRSVSARLVSQLEMWVSAIDGGSTMPDGDTSPDGLRRRLDDVAPRFEQHVVGPVRDGEAAETFVDTMCEPPQTFTLGGVLAHVVTCSAVRRTLAIGALTSAGVTDLGSGDPMHAVGGTGRDAADLTRRR